MRTEVRRFLVDNNPHHQKFIDDFVSETINSIKCRFEGRPLMPEVKEGSIVPGYLKESNDRAYYVVVDDRMIIFYVERRTEFNHIEIAITECVPDKFIHEKDLKPKQEEK